MYGAIFENSTGFLTKPVDFGDIISMISYTNHTYCTWRRIMKKPKGKYAWTVTVGEKGQIVVPKQARDVFDIKPGDTLIILGDIKRGLAIPPKSMFAQIASAVFETDAEKEGGEEN